jgi:uncharacterized membrane protein
MNQAVTEQSGSTDSARIVYILYLVGLAVGITAVVGLVMAYMNHDAAPDWLKTHYRYQIRTFWIGVVYGIVSSILVVKLIGVVLLAVLVIWWIVRCVKGLKALETKAAIENPARWGF